eukprot:CAMPEP_0202897672 /NCGR_PEP_ID=MMETSP1392-20130828/6367_1 /ASSEMBLY_ACC=CAM_ASM_000868 /TAXON_ID=225041 /ORGANISM="Chlamydomonas chlamydogama, Strain SAG 11-48b" /LENGTH=246 /DNA_ID=CAMNT_0049583367 /DNA_START=87 /DNA_END=827 /DNA_ORIENTATION=-
MAASSAYHQSYSEVDLEKNSPGLSFADALVRQGFIRKVLGLLAVQLAITTAIAGCIVASTTLKSFVFQNPAIVVLCLLLSVGSLLYMTFSETARHQHPTNLILAGVFTFGEGVLVGVASAHYSTDLVLMAFGMTAVATTALMVYALRTKEDFTISGGWLHACLMCLIAAGFVGLFFHAAMFNLAVSFVGAVLFSLYIIYDVQLLIGGHHTHKLSPDEYVFATISIYLDIINLFLYILRILGEMRDR